MEMIVLNPVGEPTLGRAELAQQVNGLAGKVLGILDDGFGATVRETLTTFERLARERLPGITVKYWIKPQASQPSPKSMLDEIASTVDAAIIGVCA